MRRRWLRLTPRLAKLRAACCQESRIQRRPRESPEKNLPLRGGGATMGAENKLTLVVRPQEVVAAVQALAQAYVDYYGAVADANRAQFHLYRAMGQPAHCLVQEQNVPTLMAPAPLPLCRTRCVVIIHPEMLSIRLQNAKADLIQGRWFF